MSNLTTIYFQLKNLLTEPAYILDLTANQNSQTRNSECAYGGERITIGIAKPGDPQKFITGVDISLTPYIPRQDLGENKYFDPIKLEEDFVESETGLTLMVTVIPEYSYLIKGSFKTRFGSLTPSESISSSGEFERMMDKVGCNIKYDFYFQNKTPVAASPSDNLDSSIDCARECYKSADCVDGWSYQIATGKCLFYDDIPIETLQPTHKLHEYEYTIGWASGLKSCTEPGGLHSL